MKHTTFNFKKIRRLVLSLTLFLLLLSLIIGLYKIYMDPSYLTSFYDYLLRADKTLTDGLSQA